MTEDGVIDMEDAFAIAQRVSGESLFVVAAAKSGDAGFLQCGDLIRIDVFERFFPFNVTGGTARITSAGTAYDSGPLPLAFERHGRSLFCHWDTTGRSPAADYTITISLQESTPRTATATVTLQAKWLKMGIPHTVRDAYCAAPGLPLEFQRVCHQDYAAFPYLGPLGRCWVHNFDIRLLEETDGTLFFSDEEGALRQFNSKADGTYSATPGDYGQLTRDPDGTFQLLEKNGRLYRFRSDLRFDSLADRNGNKITAVYDSVPRLVGVTHSCGASFQIEYNAAGRISKLTDHVGRITTYQYSNFDQHLAQVDAPGAVVTKYKYALGQGLRTDHRLTEIEHPNGTHTSFRYDEQARIASRFKDGGAGALSYKYDADGTTHILDALNHETTVKVNERAQPVEVRNAIGAVTTFLYDSAFNVAQVKDPLQRVVSSLYNENGDLVQVNDALGRETKFGYDLRFHKLAWTQDPLGIITSFEYDSRGNLARVIFPDGTTEVMTHDATGNVISRKTRRGDVIQLAYDLRGRLLQKTFPDSGFATFAYDARGNLVKAQNANAVIDMVYDDRNQITSLAYDGGSSFTFEYDAMGRRTRRVDQQGKELRWSYDAAGRRSAIRDENNAAIVSYEYDAANRCTRKLLANGVHTDFTYDAQNQLLSLVNAKSDGTVLSGFTYTYDAAGNVLTKQANEGSESYTYDNANQLAKAILPDGTVQQLGYDGNGNRTAVTLGNASTSYSRNDLNQYTAVGPVTYQYDANGCLSAKTEGGATIQYDYDFENNLIAVRAPSGTVSWKYDALGQRQFQTDGQTQTRWIWDGDQVAAETDANGALQAQYVWSGLDEIVRMERAGATFHYTLDALGSVSDLVDAGGNAIEHYRYSAFGEPMSVSAVGNPWLFTGLSYNPLSGLQFNRHRNYSPALGRFIQPDPFRDEAAINVYSYAANSPAVYIDPLGLWYVTISGGIGDFGGSISIGPGGYSITGSVGPGFGGGIFVSPGNPSGGIGASAFAGYGPAVSVSASADGTSTYGVGVGLGAGVSADATYAGAFGKGGGGRGSGSGPGGAGGGACPTFIQVPPQFPPFAARPETVAQEQLAAHISVPMAGCLLRSDIPIYGVAGGKDFKEYKVEYGAGKAPTEWKLIYASAAAQPACRVGLREMELMQGDLDLRGNLATWNVGLKSWSHLPWHPPEDPTDLNGLYTLRLTALGRNGAKAEDQMLVEVGEAIAQCLPGTVRSSDGRVLLRFPEQSLTSPFRVFSIQPAGAVDEQYPAPATGVDFIGTPYRVREPGEKFAKDVELEFACAAAEAGKHRPERIGICSFDAREGAWQWLPTVRVEAAPGVYRATLSELPAKKAIFVLAADSRKERSRVAPASPVKSAAPSRPAETGVFVHDTFEKDLGSFKQRDRLVGAKLQLEAAAGPAGTGCLKLTTENQGGNFSCTAVDRPFDIQDFHVLSFDYRIGPESKIDFLLRVKGRWYSLRFTGSPVDYRYRDVNIANLGEITGVIPDNHWHSVRFDLAPALQRLTAETRVDEIVLANWEVTGFMKLDFGRNARGTTFYLDNFKIAEPLAGSCAPADALVDDFQEGRQQNRLGGPSGVFSPAGTELCRIAVVDRPPEAAAASPGAKADRVLRIEFDAGKPGVFCGYWSALMACAAEPRGELTFRMKSLAGAAPFRVGLRHCDKTESEVLVSPYLGAPSAGGWQEAHIPFVAFRELRDFSKLDTFYVKFTQQDGSGKGTILLDDLSIRGRSGAGRITDFDAPLQTNFLGGAFEAAHHGAAAISAGHYVEEGNDGLTNGCCRISYGGTIGLDYGKQGFSYANWQTALRGFDARPFKTLRFRIRGEAGGEQPNIYLSDSVARRCVRASEFPPITKAWQEVRLPLKAFATQGIDLSRLDLLQLGFEWKPMTGTIYLDDLAFE